MTIKKLKQILIGFLILGVLIPCVVTAQSESMDFVSGLEEFRNIKRMVPDYVYRLANDLLTKREAALAAVAHSREVEARGAYIRKRFLEALGGPLPERTPLNPRVVGVLERDGYKIEKVIFESQPGLYVTANFYLPTRGTAPYPAILFPLGHEAGAKAHSAWQQALGSFAQKGFAALAWDTLGQGERVQLYDEDFGQSKVFRSTTEHTIVGIQCFLSGDSLARYTVWDGIRALDYLTSRKEVDPNRIGCTGNSGGGTHTAYLAALDDRIKVAAPSCYLTSWRKLLETIGPQDAEQILLPWLQAGLDHADFVHAFAPKPYLMLAAIRDFFSISGTRETYAEARRIYGLFQAPERLQLVEADDGHGYSRPRRLAAYNWFSRWLKGVADEAPEPEVRVASSRELNCTASGQVVTSLGGETVFSLNRKRAAQLDKNLPKLSNGDSLVAFKKEVQDRVRSLTAFENRGGALSVRSYGAIDRTGYRVEKLVYESEPGILVPSLLFVPTDGKASRPAVLYVHGEGKSAQGEPGEDIEELVKKGCVVLSIDVRGTGETRHEGVEQGSDFPRYFGDYDSAMTSLLVGRPLIGGRMLDLHRGIDLLLNRAEVDQEKVYAFGAGVAAVPVLHAAVLDERIKGVFLQRMLLSYQNVVEKRIHRQIFENVLWGVLKYYDLPDLLTSLAPRPVWIINPVDAMGQELPVDTAKKAYGPSIQVRERVEGQPLSALIPDF